LRASTRTLRVLLGMTEVVSLPFKSS
jgi:hypothetical protein